MNNIIQKQYESQTISFDLTSDMLISLTEMAKANGKRTNDWMSLPSTKSYLSALEESNTRKYGSEAKQEVIVKNGGNNNGTWASKRVAIRFAQWLSDEFAIWVDAQIDTLLTKGAVTLQPALPETYLDALKQLVIKEELNQKLMLESKAQLKEIDHKQDVIVGLVDDVQLADMRAILNRVVRHSGSPQERWRMLYKQFSAVYHCNLGLMSKRKDCSKLEYIDKHLAKLPELFRMSCRLFEVDTKQVQIEMFGVVKY